MNLGMREQGLDGTDSISSDRRVPSLVTTMAVISLIAKPLRKKLAVDILARISTFCWI